MAHKKINIKKRTVDLRELVLISFLTLVLIFNVFSTALSVQKYTSFNFWQNFPALKRAYLDSQYVNKDPKGWIPDEIVNAYAGAEYIRGQSPVLIAADTPPLGRYLIGASAIIFNNENVVTIIFSFLALFLMYKVSYQIFLSKYLAILPPLLFSFEPIFKNQIIYSPLLDIFQLVFLLLGFYYFNKGLDSKKTFRYFVLANIFLGLFISTKFFITGLTVVAAWYAILFLRREKEKIKLITMVLPISIIVLLLNYIRLFAFGYSITSFLGVQKYIFLYHKSQLILPLSIWPLLLFNKWYVWFGDKPIISDPQWLITWPLITILSLLTILVYFFKKIKNNRNLEVLMCWFIFYVLFFSFGQISSRYFVILIPVLYIISLYGIVELYKIYKK